MILCCGVLHHTPDPLAGFQTLMPLLKPGGHIVIGLYNRYGRLLTDLRRRIFSCTGGRFKWIDPILRSGSLSKAQKKTWFADQYSHPHESKHTIAEVLQWFDHAGVEFVRCVFPEMLADVDNLFEAQTRPVKADRFFTQARGALAGGREGGLFLTIGRKGSSVTRREHAEQKERMHHAAQR
ncbi:MAG: class I SAM-dependent methyltransferase [Planctomycetota bacterium]